jgi:protein-tyrosine phosphatase
MIDIHTHILHGVDDGSDTLEESVAILKSAESAGVTDIICTPHYLSREEFNKKIILKRFEELKKETKKQNININLHLGAEVAVYGRADKLFEDEDLTTLSNSKYILIEFPMAIDVDYVLDAVYEIKVRGLIPVIAHPERCECFRRNYNLITEAIEEGALIQCNIDSLLGGNGTMAKKIIKSLLKEKKVTFLVTDVHSITNNRYERLPKAMKEVEKLVGTKYKDELFEHNARNILINKV